MEKIGNLVAHEVNYSLPDREANLNPEVAEFFCRNKHIKIKCHAFSEWINLAFMGCDIEIPN